MGIKWNEFEHENKNYKLDHLWPETVTFTVPAKGDLPEKNYRVQIIYSLHCFTRGMKDTDCATLKYSDSKEDRTFCFDRYDYSFHLPKIIRALNEGYVFHTNHSSYLRLDNNGPNHYEVHFTLSRTKQKEADLLLRVNSAFERTKGQTQKAGKVKFNILLKNTLLNKKTKPYKR